MTKRKPKGSPHQTIGTPRQADHRRWAQNRTKEKWQRRDQQKYKFRVEVVRLYRKAIGGSTEQAAIERVMASYGPRQAADETLSPSTIRRWTPLVGQENN